MKEDVKNYELMLERLKNKRGELKTLQMQFAIFFANEKESMCFERNAINDLLVMQQLKSEIQELEFWETLFRAQSLKRT